MHAQVAVSKPLKLTYSWGKPAKQAATLPPISTLPLIERSGSAVADMTTAAQPNASQDAAAAAAAYPPFAPLQPATAAVPGAAWADISGTGMVRRLLQRADLGEAGRFRGQQVEVFWPQDGTWWLARVIKVRARHCCHAFLDCLLAGCRYPGACSCCMELHLPPREQVSGAQ